MKSGSSYTTYRATPRADPQGKILYISYLEEQYCEILVSVLNWGSDSKLMTLLVNALKFQLLISEIIVIKS